MIVGSDQGKSGKSELDLHPTGEFSAFVLEVGTGAIGVVAKIVFRTAVGILGKEERGMVVVQPGAEVLTTIGFDGDGIALGVG